MMKIKELAVLLLLHYIAHLPQIHSSTTGQPTISASPHQSDPQNSTYNATEGYTSTVSSLNDTSNVTVRAEDLTTQTSDVSETITLQASSLPPNATVSEQPTESLNVTTTPSLNETQDTTTQPQDLTTAKVSTAIETTQSQTTRGADTTYTTTTPEITTSESEATTSTESTTTGPASTEGPIATTPGESRTSQVSSRDTSPTTPGQIISTPAAPAATSRVTDDVVTTATHPVTGPVMMCNDTWFGDQCQYRCHCLNPNEACHRNLGTCTRCPDGWQGPGCLVEARGGTPAIVIVLAVFVACFVGLAILALLYVLRLSRRKKDQPTGGTYDNAGFNMEAVQGQGQGQQVMAAPTATAAAAKPKNEYVEVPLETVPAETKQQPMAAKKQAAVKTEPPPDPLRGLLPTVPRIQEKHMQVNDGDILGEGRFGEISKGLLLQGERFLDVAYKTLRPNATEGERQGFIGQLGLYSSIKPQQNIIQFHGVGKVEDKVYAAFEHAPYGNLRNFLRHNASPGNQKHASAGILLTQDRLLKFALHVASGMQHLHEIKIMHRELSAKNVFVGDNYIAKVGGLNIDQSPSHPQTLAAQAGATVPNKRWLPPESIASGQYTFKTDIWSYGVLVWEIMSLGAKPYADIPSAELMGRIDKGHRLPQPEECDDNVYGLLRWCWKADPSDRPDFEILSETLKELVQTAQEIPVAQGDLHDYAAVEEVPIDVPLETQKAIQDAVYDNAAANVYDNKAFSKA